MKKLYLLFLTVMPLLSFSQVNLVPNPSFEDKIVCPNGVGQIDSCQKWFNPTMGSPDYYNSCASTIQADVPLNVNGYQYARTGEAYAGIFIYLSNLADEREYIEVKLTESLVTGKEYCISFYVSYSDAISLASSRLGAYVSSDSILQNNSNVLNEQPQVENPYGLFITDSVNWKLISGHFTAAGGEKFLTIGNFYPDALTDTLRLIQSAISSVSYYIDDVSLVEMTYDVANAGSDTTICNGIPAMLGAPACNGCIYSWSDPNGVISSFAQPVVTPDTTTTYILYMHDTSTGTLCEYFSTDEVTITVNDCQLPPPNIFTPNNDGINDAFIIVNLPPQSKLVVFNRWGSEVFSSSNYDNKWQGDNLADGVYYYILKTEKGETYKGYVQIFR
ncbi:MAG TPA: gliding motility-associated C-terminal domain-containing protein [Bacteroidia bacterium]|nr:gliding motility-associated C-terminal domain-containing protein [Bacteroidia bacterium]